MAEIENVRRQGWALDNQENELEGRCIASAVMAPEGGVLAALSISSPVFRMDLARARSLVPELKAVCAEISRAVTRAGK